MAGLAKVTRETFSRSKVSIGSGLARLTIHAAIISLVGWFYSLQVPMANAETLMSTLSAVYQNNPDIEAERYGLEAASEGISQAQAGFLPGVNLEAGAGLQYNATDPRNSASSTVHSRTGPLYVTVSLVQPLFDGFRASSSTERAQALERARGQALRNAEQTVMYAGAEAFLRVISAHQVIGVRSDELAFLRRELGTARDQQASGTLSGADVYQAEARVFGAQFNMESAQADLEAWRARFVQTVGYEPRGLVYRDRIGARLPGSLETAAHDALSNHPAILAAIENVDAAQAAISVARADILPSVNLEITGTYSQSRDSADSITDGYVGVRVNVPLFDGGLGSSQVRQTTSELGQARMQLDSVRLQITANVRSTWSRHQAAILSVRAANSHVASQSRALEAVIAEERAGLRSPLDVLNAHSELVNARVNLVEAQAQEEITRYALLAAMGKFDGLSLGIAH